MKKVEMKLFNLPFMQIKEGSKTVEVRLNDEKRQQLNIGDIIVFKNNKTNELLEKEIVNLKVFNDFTDLFENYDPILLGASGYTKEQYNEQMHEIYDEDKVQQYNVLAIELNEIDTDLRERLISREDAFTGNLLKVKKDKILLPNNHESYREYIVHNGACAIVCVNDKDEVLLERQYRYPMGKVVIEIPAGKLDSVLEDHKQCAIRELEEETGYISYDMTYLGKTGLAMAYSSEIIYLYYTNKFDKGNIKLDNDEFLTTFFVPFEKALEMCDNGEIIDSKTIIGLNLYNNIIRKNLK